VSRRGLWALALAVLAAVVLPAAAAGQATGGGDGVLDSVVGDYQSASAGWLERLLPLAQRTFAVLAALEFAVSGLWWALGRETLDAALAALLRKVFVLSLFFFLLYAFPLGVPAIVSGFADAGQIGAGASGGVNPSLVLDLGITIASNLLVAYGDLGFLTDPAGAVLGSLSALIVLLCYAGIAAILCITLVESYLVLTGGCIFLGFAGFRATMPLAENYILYAVGVGTRIFLLYLLAGVGIGLARQWAGIHFAAAVPGTAPSLAGPFHVLAGSLVFCLLAWRVPTAVAARLTQGASFRLQDALR
jgi:type IV secretion system protein TrbL